MLKTSLFLASLAFLFLTTLDAIPMHEEGNHLSHLPSTPENYATKTARNRRRSSLLLPRQEANDEDLDSSGAAARSESAASIGEYSPTDTAIVEEPQEEHTREALLEQCDQFVRNPYAPGKEDADTEETLFADWSQKKEELFSSLYADIESILKKIPSIEKQDLEQAAQLWNEIEEDMKQLLAVFEKYETVCNTSSHSEEAQETAGHIQFYNARLLEYEAESQTTELQLARQRNLSSQLPSASSQTSTPSPAQHYNYVGNELLAQHTSSIVCFDNAAQAYEDLARDRSPEITALYKIMALRCNARSLENKIFYGTDHAQITKNDPRLSAITKPIQDSIDTYEVLIKACTKLLPQLSEDEEWEVEKAEVEKYLTAATKKKTDLETVALIPKNILFQECDSRAGQHDLSCSDIPVTFSPAVSPINWQQFGRSTSPLPLSGANNLLGKFTNALDAKKLALDAITRDSFLAFQQLTVEPTQKAATTEAAAKKEHYAAAASLWETAALTASMAAYSHQKAVTAGNDYLKLLLPDTAKRKDLEQTILLHEREARRWEINSSFDKANTTGSTATAFKEDSTLASYHQAHFLLDQAIEQAIYTHEAFQAIYARLATQQNRADIEETALQNALTESITWQNNLEAYQQMKADRKKTCWDSICESFANFTSFWSSMMPRWSFRRTAVN